METAGQQEKMQRFMQLSEKIAKKEINLNIIKDIKAIDYELFSGGIQVNDEIKAIRINNNKQIAYWANRNIDIADFVRDCNFVEKGSTQRWPRYEKGNEVLLITENNTVVKAKSGQRQNLFDFIKEHYPKMNHKLSDTSHFINEILKKEGVHLVQAQTPVIRADRGEAIAEPCSKEQKIFNIHDYRVEPLNVEKNYLNTRGIKIETLRDPLFNGTVLSGNKVTMEKWQNNVIYPFRQHPEQQELSTLMMQYGKKIEISGKMVDKIFAPGEGKARSMWMSNVPESVKYIRVMENPLDCLSHYQLYKPKNSLYVATGGRPAREQLELIDELAKQYHAQPVLSFDRDMAGYRFDASYMEHKTQAFRVVGPDEKVDIIFENLKADTKDYLITGLELRNISYSIEADRVIVSCENAEDIGFCTTFVNATTINNKTPIIYEKSVMKDWNDDLSAGIQGKYKTIQNINNSNGIKI